MLLTPDESSYACGHRQACGAECRTCSMLLESSKKQNKNNMGLPMPLPNNMLLYIELHDWFIDLIGHLNCRVSSAILLYQANAIAADIRSAHQEDIAAGRIVAGAKHPGCHCYAGPQRGNGCLVDSRCHRQPQEYGTSRPRLHLNDRPQIPHFTLEL